MLFGVGRCAVVRVSEPVRQACAHEFSFAPSKSDADAHDVIASRKAELGGRGAGPLMQRDRELRLLDQLLDDVRRRGRPHLVTLLGEAGVGKSRILHEFRRAIRERGGARCLVGCNRSFGPDSPYASLEGVVRSYAGITDADGPAELTNKLRVAVTGLVGTGPIASQLVKNLRDLLVQGAGLADTKPVFAAWRRLVQEIAAREPLVIILEDLNRVDDVLLKFVGDMAELAGMLPLLLVVTGRLELAERDSYWSGGRRNASTMSIDPLSRSATHTLLSDLLTRAEPTEAQRQNTPTGEKLAAVCANLVDQVGGNPLFAMEYVRLVHDGAMSTRALAGEPGAAAGPNVPVPQKVHNIIATRLDTLSPAEKAVLYDAAVLGDSFCRQTLAVLGDREATSIEECLDTLERHDLVRRSRFGVDLGHVEYTFTHSLVREVAYSRLPRALRADKHMLAAEWLCGMSGEPVGLMAHHYKEAVEHASYAGLDTRDIARRACDGLIQAGHQALARGAQRTALHGYRAALDFCPPDHPQLPELLRWSRDDLTEANPPPRPKVTPSASLG
ncbi:AAA family ATPase [Kutzneria sp. 744]|uniref:ATP-binding protein n=1 Tax=Kutzneria sp. (strain 744) TaxID=345341 RepID=UPI0004B29E67|nr:AAA family ATPase [Kutzneria sp. 744]